MEDPKCKDCAHFRQHYIHWDRKSYVEVPCGHCVRPRLKHRKPETCACVHFLRRHSKMLPE